MKRATIVQILISGLLVLSLTGGCTRPPPPSVTKTIAQYADDAARAADDALLASRAAQGVDDVSELRPLLTQADDAAQQALRAADEAETAAQQLGNLSSQGQTLDDLLRAQRAAEIARLSRTSIDEVLNNPELFGAWIAVDDISDDIVRGVTVQSGPDEQQVREALKNVAAGSFCDALLETMNTGQYPTGQEVVDSLEENVLKAVITLSGLNEISTELLWKLQDVVTRQPPDELERYKAYCERVFGG